MGKSVSVCQRVGRRGWMDDLRDRAGVRLALEALLKKEPLTTTEFHLAVNQTLRWAAELRDAMESWGLVRVEQEFEGRVRYQMIYLTPEGRTAAQERARYDAALLRAKEKKERRDTRRT